MKALLITVFLLVGLGAAFGQGEPRASLASLCHDGRLTGIVTDPYDAPLARARVEIVSVDQSGGARAGAISITGQDGRFVVACPSGNAFQLRVSVSGFPTRTIASDEGLTWHDEVAIRLGVPCDGEVAKDMLLTDSDRHAIYTLLLERAFAEERGGLLLRDRAWEALGIRAPRGVRLVTRRRLETASRSRTVHFVALSAIEIRGRCVLGGFDASCYSRGEVCTVCCESQSYVFMKTDGKWQATPYWGSIS